MIMRHNLIRLGGRLQFADLSHTEKHPILLDGSHHVTHLLIRRTHIQLHNLGVRVVLSHLRHEFWIVRTRRNIKMALRACLPCKIASNARWQEVEAILPAERVQPSTPFVVTGLDFACPLYTKKDKSAKFYIVLLTCATIRALNLELSSHMSVDKFLMALDSFVSRRGLPTLSTPITPLHFKQPVENWTKYVPFWTTHRHPTTSLIEALPGLSLPHGRLGGEDGGSIW